MNKINLDELNNKRVNETKLNVAKAIRLLNNPINCMLENIKTDNACTNIANAVNLLETCIEEMNWACDHFKWDNSITDLFESACARLSIVLAFLVDEKTEDDYDLVCAGCDGKSALALLGQSLATLIRWFDDD